MPNWNDRTYLQAVQFEYEAKALGARAPVGYAPRIGDPVRVKLAGVEVEGRIVEVADSVLHVRIGKTLF